MSEDLKQPLPVAGYKPQSAESVALANECKELEERVLRAFDKLWDHDDTDKRMLSLAKTNVQQAFMWAVRSIFQPARVALPEDSPEANRSDY